MQALLVKVDDVVQIGQVVALIDENSATKQAHGVQISSQSAYDALTDAASELSDKTLKGHKARIRFPPRRTSDGHVISAMPAVDQPKYINRSSSTLETSWIAQTKPSSGGQNAQVQNPRLSNYIPRRTLSDREMDAIMLGGAD